MINIKLGKYIITSDTSNFILSKEKEIDVIKDKVKTGERKIVIDPIGYFASLPQLFNRYRKETILSYPQDINNVDKLIEILETIQREDISWCKENLKKWEV